MLRTLRRVGKQTHRAGLNAQAELAPAAPNRRLRKSLENVRVCKGKNKACCPKRMEDPARSTRLAGSSVGRCGMQQGRTTPHAAACQAPGAGTCWTQGSRRAATESCADTCVSVCTGFIWVLPQSVWNISCTCKWQLLISTESFRWHFQRCY